jgi:hypothetical protein
MQRRIGISSLICAALLGGCTTVSPPATPRQPMPPPDHAALANARYTGVLARPLTLDDGAFVAGSEGGASRDEVRLIGTTALGDIDGNGVDEAAVVLRSSGGGSGSFIYLGIADRDDLDAIPMQLVGDRVQIRALSATAEEVHADVVRAGPDDAACCPGEAVTLTWHYSGGTLSAPHAGVARRLGIEDFAGHWQLESLDDAAPGAAVTLHIEGAQISGQAVCNQYSGRLELGTHPGQVHVGPVSTTLMACPDASTSSLERRYLDALTRVQTYSFAPGRLLLGYFKTPDADGTPHELIFARDEARH